MRRTPIKVLLIEDNSGDVRLLREGLCEASDIHFFLECADRLSTGLERLAIGGIDVILLDLTLPDCQGLETFVSVHAHAPSVPVLVLTGQADEAMAVKAVGEGAQDYLVKGQVDGKLLARAMRYAIERHRLLSALRSLSLIDGLTGLYNRRGFLTLAEQHLKLAQRTDSGMLLFFADLDGLKQINDTFGHEEGDRALIKIAEILRVTFRDSDLVARLGGDEFTVLAIHASGNSAEIMTSRLQENLREWNAQCPRSYELSLSVGVAHFNPRNAMSVEKLIGEADDALYERKRTRSGTVKIER